MTELMTAVRLIRKARGARTDREHAEHLQQIERLRRSSPRGDFAVCLVELLFENATVMVILVCMASFAVLYQLVKALCTSCSGS
jgi:hypothetical protein